MTQKRSFIDEVISEVPSKHPRQDGHTDEIISRNDSVPTEDGFNKPRDSGEAIFQNSELVTRQEHVNDFFPEIPKEDVEDMDTEMPQSASLSHRATSSTSDEDEPHDLLHVPFFPGYFSFDRPVRSVINPDDVYYCLLDYPPRKQVPVGPEYQAEIPELYAHGKENTSEGFITSEPSDYDAKFDGICIIPSPDDEPLPYNGQTVGDGRIACNCQDQATIRCVRQHITEARDKLKNTLGQETLLELGFYDMGEVVAEKWGEEEEQLFHEVVYSNPASLGRNFWNALSAVFPSRTQMEIVSYYFNVFMLRKRATQNRFDPLNIDSDNDECQGSDDDGGDEDEDSGVESPVRQDGVIEFHQNGYLSDEAQENDDYDSMSYARKSDPDSNSEIPSNKSLYDDLEENDANDGSCTSSDSGGVSQMKPESCQEWRGYLIESSEAKTWDDYNNLSFLKDDIDLLPTCSMIEEVFGDADIDSNDKRW